MKFRILSVMMVAAAAMATSACGGGGGGGEGGGGGSGDGGSGNNTTTQQTTTMATTVVTTSTTTTMGPTCETDCTACADFATCADCFVTQEPAGYEAFATELVAACGCAATATCIAECDTMDPASDICGDMGPDLTKMNQACVDCINNLPNDDACFADFQTGCQANQECIDFVGLLQSCPN